MQQSIFVMKTEDITFTRAACDERLHGIVNAAIAEVPKKRIARAQRKKRQGWRLHAFRQRKKPIHYFVGSAITPDRDELTMSLAPSFTSKGCRVTRSRGFTQLNFKSSTAQLVYTRSDTPRP